MAQYRISPGVVREEFFKIMSDCSFWEMDDKDSEKLLTYIAGARDMANAIIKRYEDGDRE